MTGGYLLGGGLIAFLIWYFVVVGLRQSPATLGLRGASLTNLLPVVLVYVFFIVPLGLCAHLWTELIEYLGYESMPQEVVKMFGDAVARGDPLELSLLVFNAVSLAAFLPLFVVGMAVGYVYYRTRSLYFAIFFHALFNGLSMAVQFILVGS